jgi:hypothetical protein
MQRLESGFANLNRRAWIVQSCGGRALGGEEGQPETEEVFATIRACPPSNAPAADPPQKGRLSQHSLNAHARSSQLRESETCPRSRENWPDSRSAP